GSRPLSERGNVSTRQEKGGDYLTMATENIMAWTIAERDVYRRAGDFLPSVDVEVQILVYIGSIGDQALDLADVTTFDMLGLGPALCGAPRGATCAPRAT